MRQALNSLVAQLNAASNHPAHRCTGPAGEQLAAGGAPAHRCTCPGGEGRWTASAGPPRRMDPSRSQRHGQHPNGWTSNGRRWSWRWWLWWILRGTRDPAPPFQLPQELTWFQGAGESIRTVDLPSLPGIKEGELGGVVIGDWLALISPMMKDLGISSGAWWVQPTTSGFIQSHCRSCTLHQTCLESAGLHGPDWNSEGGGLGEKALLLSEGVGGRKSPFSHWRVLGAGEELEEESHRSARVAGRNTRPNVVDGGSGPDEQHHHEVVQPVGLQVELS